MEIVVSEAILKEVGRVIHYPRIQGRYQLSEEKIERFLGLLRRYAILSEPHEQIDAVQADPSDNRYLEAALAGEASYVVSGDRHLLDLKRYRDIQILAPNEFMTFLKLERKGWRVDRAMGMILSAGANARFSSPKGMEKVAGRGP